MGNKIAIIKFGALGDVVRTTCILPALKRTFGDIDVTWLTSLEAAPLLEGNPYISRLITADVDPFGSWSEDSYDWVISLDDDDRPCAIAAGLRTAKLSGGYKTASGCRYTADVEPWFGMGLLRPKSEGGLAKANQLKQANQNSYGEILYRCLGLPAPVARPSIYLSPSTREWASRWMAARQPKGPIIGLNTGAGARWRFKSWGEDQTAELARELIDRIGATVVLLGGTAEFERNRQVLSQVRRENAFAAPTNLDFLSFAALIECCAAIVVSDSLALHLATALHRPIVAFFGPTSAAEIHLYETGEKVITPLNCRTCYLKTCDVSPNCMESITVQKLFEATIRQLEHRSPDFSSSISASSYGE